jgi:adenylyltransferase/sulfurtransferase
VLDATERERYGRHLLLPELGDAGQQRLKAARILLVGAGGLGSPAALYLAAAGVGTLCIVDHDCVELSNLQRQVLYDTADVGAPKAEAAARRLRALNPGTRVDARLLRVDAGNVLELVAGHDLVVDGSDRLPTRYLVADACVLAGKPLVSAAIHRFEGQAFSFRPGAPCYRCLFPESARAAAPSCAEAGVLGVLPGILGSVQAAEAIKLVAGIGTPLLGRLLTFDALEMRWQEFRFERRADCAVCGAGASIRSPADTLASLVDNSSAAIRRFPPAELQQRMRTTPAGAHNIHVVDVREPAEYAAGHLPGSLNLPLGTLPGRLDALAGEVQPVFVCRSGARSLQAAQAALAAGVARVGLLEGGLLAWQSEIDAALVVAPAPSRN